MNTLPLCDAVRQRDVTKVRKLLSRGFLQRLMSGGFEINAREATTYGPTALHLAVLNNEPTITQLLLSAGADPNVADAQGDAPIHSLQSEGSEIVRLLTASGGLIDAKNHNGSTILHIAIENSYSQLASALIGLGASIESRDYLGRTALHSAIYMWASDCDAPQFLKRDPVVIKRYRDIVSALLGHQANANAQNDEGDYPLHTAAAHGAIEIVEMLLERGADIHAHDRLGKTAADVAEGKGSTDIVRRLRHPR